MTMTPAGWYQDPEAQPGDLRYWDGAQWTQYRHPADHPAPPEPAPVAPPPVAPPPVAPPPTPPTYGTPTAPAGPPPGGGKKKPIGLIIAILAVVVLLLVGGTVTAIVLTSGSSAKKPAAWAAAFCAKVEKDAVTLQASSDSIQSEDLDAVADFLDQTATFLDKMATTITDLGAPDTTGGKQMVQEIPKGLRATATQFRSISNNVRDGNVKGLNSIGDIKPAGDLGPAADSAWTEMQSQFTSSKDCATLSDVFK